MTRTAIEIERDRDSLKQQIRNLEGEALKLKDAMDAAAPTDGQQRALDAYFKRAQTLDVRQQELDEEWREAFDQAVRARRGVVFESADLADQFPRRTGGAPRGDIVRHRVVMDGLEAIDRLPLGPSRAASLRTLVEDPADREALGARYLSAVADPDYESAFGAVLSGASPFELNAREHAAMRRVGDASRALGIGTGPGGGFALPATIDPTIMLSNDGVADPIRRLARVERSATNEWTGVSSAGLTAGYGYRAPSTQAEDNAPVLGQPRVVCQKGQAFVPFEIEIGQDWATLTRDLLRVFNDGHAEVDATAFLHGLGPDNDEPWGILADGLTEVTGGATYEGCHDLIAAVPSRFQDNLTVMASLSTFLAVRQLVGAGDPDNQPIVNDDLTRFLGRPTAIHSAMDPGVIVAGDFRQGFIIVDRLGATVELVPHLFGADRRPIGQRGAYYYWRTGSVVAIDNAFRILGHQS